MKNQTESWTPQELASKLKESVIGQDKYVEDLCTAVWTHKLRMDTYVKTGNQITQPKLNMLVLGKSGSGKTLTIQTLAKLLDVNLVIEDASQFTGAGWKGRDTSEIIKDIIESSSHDPLQAEYSIVVLDEIDKLFEDDTSTVTNSAINNFLKLVEGSIIEHVENKMAYTMDTTNVLFICLGAFDGLEDIIQGRMHKGNGIGFCADQATEMEENIFLQVQKEDLIKFGVSPQFLGRFPMITATNELDEDDFYRILTESKVSAVNRYDELLQASLGVRASMTNSAARYVAEKAANEGTGARALMMEVAEAYKEGMFNIASRTDVCELKLEYTPAYKFELLYIKGKRQALPRLNPEAVESRLSRGEWSEVSMELFKYENSLAGVCLYVEELVEELELKGDGRLDKFKYRQMRGAINLIISSVLGFTTPGERDMGMLRDAMNDIVISFPYGSKPNIMRDDTYVTYFWKSLDHEPDISKSVRLATYLLEEYCIMRLEEGDTQEMKGA